MTTSRPFRAFRWFLFNGLCSTACWYGVNGVKGAANVYMFFLGVSVFTGIIIRFSKETRDKMKSKGPSVPLWVSVPYDITMITFLVWNDWWWSAFGVMLTMIFEAGTYIDDEETPVIP